MKDGVPFVKALLALEDGKDEKTFDTALNELESIRAELVDPMRNLLIGYSYLEKFKLSKQGVDYDRELWQKAHQSLILAADLARGRSRVRAAALSNLGLLHLWGLNYNQSVRFWEMRKQMGFDDQQMKAERQAFTWYYSQALFMSGQTRRAAEEMASLPMDLQTEEFAEHRAFYLAMGEDYAEALKAYEKVLSKMGSDFAKLPEPSRTKVRLGYAFTLFKLGKAAEAKNLFNKILSEGLKSFKAEEGTRSLAFEPNEVEILVWGFLAQLGSMQDREQALNSRLALLKDDLPAMIQARQQLSELVSPRDPKAAAELMKKSLQETLTFTEDNGPLGQLVFRSLTNYMVHVLLFDGLYQGDAHKGLAQQLEKTLAALTQQGEFSPLPIQKEQWRLQYLWNLFQERVLKANPNPQWREDLLKNPLSARLQKEDASGFEQLQKQMLLL
jgi:hypothetical protein